MRIRFFLLLGVAFALLATMSVPSAVAAVETCNGSDITDTQNDVAATPVDASAVTGFAQLDIRKVCLAETAAFVAVQLTVGANCCITNAAQDFHWQINFTANGAAKNVKLDGAGGTNTFTPAGQGAIQGTVIQFNLSRATFASGTNLSSFQVWTHGTFVNQAGNIITGVDRAPDAAGAVASFTYTVGARAPDTLDSDGDGVSDKQEVAAKTHPGRADTDEDGLLDGADLAVPAGDARAATFNALGIFQPSPGTYAGEKTRNGDPLKADADDDGLLDGANVTVASGSSRATNLSLQAKSIPLPGGQVKFVGEIGVKTKANVADTDGDGLADGAEVFATRNAKYPRTFFLAGLPGSTDPATPDTDKDGLKDGEETSGKAVLGGTTYNFSPTDPNARDTDGDRLTDSEEILGKATIASTGEVVNFTPTDPVKGDTDGDGFDDYQEVAGEADPRDPNDEPRGGPESEIAYLLISALAMIAVLFASVAGILWRWA